MNTYDKELDILLVRLIDMVKNEDGFAENSTFDRTAQTIELILEATKVEIERDKLDK